MSRQHHYYGANHLHYLTKSTYRRVRVFDSDRFRLNFIRALDDSRAQLDFKIMGYALMPEHCHLLLWPSELADPSQVVKRLGGPYGLIRPEESASQPEPPMP